MSPGIATSLRTAVVAYLGAAAVSTTPLSAQVRVPGYRLTVPDGWQQSTTADGARFVKQASNGSDVVLQFRAPVVAIVTPPAIIERLLGAIVAADGLHDANASPISSQTFDRRALAVVGGSFLDRTNTPVYLLLLAVSDGLANGVLHAESRNGPAMKELLGEIEAIATASRVAGRTMNTQVRGALVTAPSAQLATSAEEVASDGSGSVAPPNTQGEARVVAPAPLLSNGPPWPPMSDGPRLSGVWTMFETGWTPDGPGILERIYVYWPDGRVLMRFPQTGVAHPGETRFEGVSDDYWGRYTVRKDSLVMTWNDGKARRTYALSRSASPNLDRATIRPAGPPVRNLRLRGTWEAVGYEPRRFITLDDAGRFFTGDSPVTNKAGRGTYVIDGYAIELRFDTGEVDRASFLALEAGSTPRTIRLERMTLALRR